jgi:NAD(P)-dependent dehydrogenase (short-subunit alcohol dehydrogenase family)
MIEQTPAGREPPGPRAGSGAWKPVPARKRALRRAVPAVLLPVVAVAVLTTLARGSQAGVRATAAGDEEQLSRAMGGQERVILITGSTDGLGREVARRLAARGAHVIVHGRNRERGEALIDEIERSGTGSAAFYAADLASLQEVRELATAIQRDYERLDVLVNNAGIWRPGASERALSADGHELHFAVNYLSGFLLTRLLLPLLHQSTPSRIVNVSSMAQTPIDFDDVMLSRGYSGSRGYAQSKLAQVMFTFDLAAELEGSGVWVGALHPATLMNTQMVEEAGARPRSTVEEGADALMQLVTARDLESGLFFNGLRPARANGQAYDDDARAQLRTLSYELTGAPR